MDVINQETIGNLLNVHAERCISMFMPTHRAGRGIQQDPIRLKNLLREADEKLVAAGMRPTEARDLLDPVRRLLDDSHFWRHQSDGLALFVSPDEVRMYRLPISFDELVIVAERFHIRPLLPFITNDGHFYMLVLSQNEVRWLEGTRQTVDEVDLGEIPASLAESLKYTDFEKELQFHSGTQSTPGSGDRPSMYHGHDPADDSKTRILSWFKQINNGLHSTLSGQKSPLVLAGVDYLLPIYGEANTYPQLLDDGILGNPEEMSAEELHSRAWLLVEPCFTKAQEQALDRFHQLSNTELAVTDINEIIPAAHDGRIDVLLIADGAHVWGNYDPETRKVHIHPEPELDGEDLLDTAVVRTYLTGGEIYVVDPKQIADNASVAAVFRY